MVRACSTSAAGVFLCFCVLSCTYALSLQSDIQRPIFAAEANHKVLQSTETCTLASAITPVKHLDLDRFLEELYSSKAFQLHAINSLSAVIQVPSETYDGLGPIGQDPRWDSFKDLHAEFEALFPLVFASLNVTKVNTYGLVFHWQGTDSSLKPILMTAHQDVVPVEQSTIDQWIHPPYSGYYDGEWIWGRGSCDDKPDVISQLTTIDTLLKNSFEPTRTFVFAYGFDEESAGHQGAGRIAEYLEATYAQDSFAALLDEGFGFEESQGGDVIFAVPCTGEKGYLDVSLVVHRPGGHSSIPPPHTAIGILASAIAEIESHSYTPSLSRSGTAFKQIRCQANYDSATPDLVRELVEEAVYDDDALEELERVLLDTDPLYTAMFATTQAVNVVTGGMKATALPQRAEAIINHEIAEHSSVGEVEDRITAVVLPISKRYNITLKAFGKMAYVGDGDAGDIVLTEAWNRRLEPAPMTPTVGSEPWDMLSGTIKAVLDSSRRYSNRELVVVPTLALGNTDTQFYWNLTKHIFRYSHANNAGMTNGSHGVNEALKAESLIDKIRFHTKWILNWDESDI